MVAKLLEIIDPFQNVVATVRVTEDAGRFFGTIDLSSAPEAMRRTFARYEEIVNGQMFSYLDDIEQQIDALRLRAQVADGNEACLQDLQVYPSTGRVSFRLACQPQAAANRGRS